MPRRRRQLFSILAAGAAMAVAAAGLQPGAAQAKPKPTKPTKVVIIVVDALSKEIVDKYKMKNVRHLMSRYVDTPNGYLGHTGIGDEGLAPVQHEATALRHGARLHGRCVRARAGLGQPPRSQRLTAGEARQVRGLLLF